jgi:hypothetical protein
MGSDLARVSYDPSRKWRGLVAQQGRVTVEADWNEAAAIQAAGDRAVTLDVVGPVGTPDDGYAVTETAPGSAEGALRVGPGTLYLGGERLALGTAVHLGHQPDWLDKSTGKLWVAPQQHGQRSGTDNELVYLLAIEQEVSALEDPALADVALGGPDTMQRLRILQRFVRWPTQANRCEQAWREVQEAWARIGLQLCPASMRLESTATLQVGFVTEPAAPNASEPAATAGYLGAENQLIRVQVASVDDGVPTIVWGFDDATFLYKLTSNQVDSSGQLVLTLANAPVDSYHNPVAGQAVELLRDAAYLTPDDPELATTAEGSIAAAAGRVYALTQGYDSSSGTVAIAGSLPDSYEKADQLYLRVWQGSMPAPSDTVVELTGAGATTGVTVKLSSAGGGFHPGDFWRFALRPGAPNLTYPARCSVAPQPPDGARVLACPVALVTRPATDRAEITSCIPQLDSLAGLTTGGGGCCTLKVTPDDVATTSLNVLLARQDGKGPITVCFAPGTYTLTEPLVLDTSFADITLESCGGRVILQGPADPGSEFILGLIVLDRPSGVAIRGIELVAPHVSFAPAEDAFVALFELAGSTVNQKLLDEFGRNLLVGIGISARDTRGLVVEDCTFVLGGREHAHKPNIFSAGIFASGVMPEATVSRCTFRTTRTPSTVRFHELLAGEQPPFPFELTLGYLQAPVSAREASAIGLLHDATIEGCRFLGLTVPALVVAQLGTIRMDCNTVQDCYGGIWLFSVANSALINALDLLLVGDAEVHKDLSRVGLSALGDAILVIARAFARVLPATPPIGRHLTHRAIAHPDPATRAAAAQGLRTLLEQTASDLSVEADVSRGAPAPPVQHPEQPHHREFPFHHHQTETVPFRAVESTTPPGLAPIRQQGRTAESTSPAGRDLLDLLPALKRILAGLGTEVVEVDEASFACDTGRTAVLRLAVAGSQIDAVVPDSYSGAGLLVADLTGTPGSALLTGNRIRNRFPEGQAAVILRLTDAAVTGNIIANEVAIASGRQSDEDDEANVAATITTHSLLLHEGPPRRDQPPVAIVGNVFVDPPSLPHRPAQLLSWRTLNTVVSFTET